MERGIKLKLLHTSKYSQVESQRWNTDQKPRIWYRGPTAHIGGNSQMEYWEAGVGIELLWESLLQCHFFQHKFHVVYNGI
jgi:hypothetical protein